MATATKERLISSDDHVDVGHDDVKSHLASKFHDDYDRGVEQFRTTVMSTASAEANQRWREQQGLAPDPTVSMANRRRHEAAGRPGHTDAKARLQDMDFDGVDASVSYCEVSAFRYLYLIKNGWEEATRAFNDTLTEWAARAPDRLIINYQIPIHDVDAAVREIHRAAANGCKSLQLPVFPTELGLPDYWESRYDPIWAAIQDVDLPVCLHIGMNTALDGLARRDPTPQKGIFVEMVGLSTAEAMGMLIMGGVFAKFPRLKVVFVEPGVGWVAWWLYIADDFVERQGYEFPALEELPSHYFHQNVHLTFIDEPDVVHHAKSRLGIHNVMWSSDYPHPVSSWPHSQAIVDKMFSDVSAEDRELIVAGNAARVWKL